MAEEAPSRALFKPEKPEDWEPHREVIKRLYAENTLKMVMEEMKRVHSFSATEKQYKTKIKDWGLANKYVKDFEYEELLKQGDKPLYEVRNKTVPHQDVARYKRRKNQKNQKSQKTGGSSGGGAGGDSSSSKSKNKTRQSSSSASREAGSSCGEGSASGSYDTVPDQGGPYIAYSTADGSTAYTTVAYQPPAAYGGPSSGSIGGSGVGTAAHAAASVAGSMYDNHAAAQYAGYGPPTDDDDAAAADYGHASQQHPTQHHHQHHHQHHAHHHAYEDYYD